MRLLTVLNNTFIVLLPLILRYTAIILFFHKKIISIHMIIFLSEVLKVFWKLSYFFKWYLCPYIMWDFWVLGVVFELFGFSWQCKSILDGTSCSKEINPKSFKVLFSCEFLSLLHLYHLSHIYLTHMNCIHCLHLLISISDFFLWSANLLLIYLKFVIDTYNCSVIYSP